MLKNRFLSAHAPAHPCRMRPIPACWACAGAYLPHLRKRRARYRPRTRFHRLRTRWCSPLKYRLGDTEFFGYRLMAEIGQIYARLPGFPWKTSPRTQAPQRLPARSRAVTASTPRAEQPCENGRAPPGTRPQAHIYAGENPARSSSCRARGLTRRARVPPYPPPRRRSGAAAESTPGTAASPGRSTCRARPAPSPRRSPPRGSCAHT